MLAYFLKKYKAITEKIKKYFVPEKRYLEMLWTIYLDLCNAYFL